MDAAPKAPWWNVYHVFDPKDARRHRLLGQVRAANQPAAMLAAFARWCPTDNAMQAKLFVRDSLKEAEGQTWCMPS